MTCWGVWSALRLAVLNNIVVVECSDRLKKDEIEHVFSDAYVFLADVIDAADVGWLGRRRRFWGVMISRADFIEACCTIDHAVRLFQRVCNITWRDAMVAKSDELLAELRVNVQRAGSIATLKGLNFEAVLKEPFPFRCGLLSTEWERVKTAKERRGPHRVYMANQGTAVDSSGFCVASVSETLLHTIICLLYTSDAADDM
eukprot:10055213-Alexandrium_andersonii.AAC.1